MRVLTGTLETETGFEVFLGESIRLQIDKTPNGADAVDASASVYSATHVAGHALELLYVQADNGERWVECRVIDSTAPRLLRLDSGLRLVVKPTADGKSFCELRQARPKGERWSNLYKATIAELDGGAGVSVGGELRHAGAAAFGTREAELSERGSHRSFMCAVFDRENEGVPILAFLLTRVAPLLRS